MKPRTVSVITVSCFDNRLNLLALSKMINTQMYKHIKEWVIYDESEDVQVFEFAEFIDKLKQSMKCNVILLNHADGRVSINKNSQQYRCDQLNKLTEAANSEVVAVMTDRDIYDITHIRNAVEIIAKYNVNATISYYPMMLDVRNDGNESACYRLYAKGKRMNVITYSLTFKHRVFSKNKCVFNGEDNIYGSCRMFMNDMYYKSVQYHCPNLLEGSFCVNSHELNFHKYAAEKCKESELHPNVLDLIQKTIQMKKNEYRAKCKSYLIKMPEEDNCIVCFDMTNLATKCKHALCANCSVCLSTMENSCPYCRQSYR